MSDVKKTGRTPPDDIPATAAQVAGAVKRPLQGLGIGGDPGDPLLLDPHGQAADFTLRPDPTGSRDPIGRPDLDPHARAAGGADPSGLTARADTLADRAGAAAGQAKETVSALADDVRDRLEGAADDARAKASDTYEGARTWVAGVHQEHMRRIDDAVVRGSEGLNRGRSAVEQFVTENPLLVGVVGVAAGLLLGALIPRTRQEDRNLGPYADEMRDQGLRYAREFTNRGREFVATALDPENVQAAAEKATGREEPGYAGGDRTAHRL